MPETALDNLITSAVAEVLETMFFTEIVDVGAFEPDPSAMEARVAFTGDNSGTVSIRISRAAAESLTASFLGESEESLSDTQVAHLVCELANILCGCIVSKMAAHGCFNLSSPQLIGGLIEESTQRPEMQKSFTIERGALTVSLSE